MDMFAVARCDNHPIQLMNIFGAVMLIHPQFDPVALALGPVKIHWYGLTYVVAFVLFVVLGRIHAKRRPDLGYDAAAVEDIMFFGILGVMLGGRLGYILFYKFVGARSPNFPLAILPLYDRSTRIHGTRFVV